MSSSGQTYTYTFSLGSNIGRRMQTMRQAMDAISRRVGRVTSCSPMAETEPWGYQSTHRYLNCALEATSCLAPREVLAVTQQIERELGRESKTVGGHYEDRVIDIDILLCDKLVIYSPELRIPHPRMWQRAFVTDCLRKMLLDNGSGGSCNDAVVTAPRAATIGFFDGAHLGHRHLAQQLVQLNRGRDAKAVMLTFDRHPHDAICPDEPPVALLSTPAGKREAFAYLRRDVEMWCMEFSPAMAALTAREFMQYVLREQLNIDTLLIGYDHHFGRPLGGETFDDYVRYGLETGIRVVRATELDSVPCHVSSSAIRRAIASSDFARADAMLGYAYTWYGRVVHGDAIGRRLGFPTANLEALHPETILPPGGVYAAMVTLPGGRQLPAMLNIGTRPTIAAPAARVTVEAHIIGLHDDIYGLHVGVNFRARLRDEHRFGSTEELARQLRHDRDEVVRLLGGGAAGPAQS